MTNQSNVDLATLKFHTFRHTVPHLSGKAFVFRIGGALSDRAVMMAFTIDKKVQKQYLYLN